MSQHLKPFSRLRQVSTLNTGSAGQGTDHTGVHQTSSSSDVSKPLSEASSVLPWPRRLDYSGDNVHLPRNVQALYLRPLRRSSKYGLPTCDVQFRSYSVRNVEFFSDFALRAAYYLNLCASGPVPLPRIVERWTVPRSNFVHKKSQENFERVTLRRLIQIRDGHPEVVQLWLAFLRRHAFYGVGMKANIWENESLEFNEHTESKKEDVKSSFDLDFSLFGIRDTPMGSEKSVLQTLQQKYSSRSKGPLSESRI